LLERRTLKLLLLVCFWFSANAMAIGGRGGAGEGGGRGGEGAHFGDGGGVRFGGRLGGSGNYTRSSVTRDGFGHRLPAVVTAEEEGGKIHGHDYDPDGVDLTERALHRNEYAVLSGGQLANWQSSNDAKASEAIAYRARGVRTLAILFSLAVLAIAMCILAYR
jgi:hypothetical protein